MASAAPSTNTPQDPNPRGAPTARGRGRRGGQGGDRGSSSTRTRGGRGDNVPRRGRGGARGGGERGPSNGTREQQQNDTQAPRQQLLEVRPKLDNAAGDDAASESGKTCFICADSTKFHAIMPCNHPICHTCAVRMRALWKKKDCPHCRTEAEIVIFTDKEDKLFDDFTDADIVDQNESLGIKFDNMEIAESTQILLRYNCPEVSCDKQARSWADLQRHVKTEHNKMLCDHCIRHRKAFSHELQLYSKAELKRHEEVGDNVLGSETQTGFTGHPGCEFCKTRFYSGDELYEHCRHNHERCHICDRTGAKNAQYYLDYMRLEEHFRKQHYACMDRECLEKKFVVFDNEVDLKAHQLEVHPNGLTKEARRDARRIDMSTFQDARPTQGRGGSGRDGRNRNRDATRGHQEPQEQPIRTEQNMSRAEIAYHRQLAIQSSQSTTTRTFGGQLSEPTQTVSAPVSRPTSTPPVANPFPPLGRRLTPPVNEPSRPAARVPMSDEVRRLKHEAVLERAGALLRNDSHKLNLFRNNISNYRTKKIPASSLVDNFWGLFDVTANDLGKLLHELAELFEDETKKTELLKAWNNWKAINEDYPPIAGTSQSAIPSASHNNVMRIKSSTMRSARSSTNQTASWNKTPATYNPSYNPTPAQSNPNRSVPGSGSGNLWVPSGSGSGRPPAVQVVPAPTQASRVGSAGKLPSKSEFPGLPPKKVTPGWTPVVKKPNSWEPAGPSTSAWDPNAGGNDGFEEYNEEDFGKAAGKKKKGKGKQILFKVGL